MNKNILIVSLLTCAVAMGGCVIKIDDDGYRSSSSHMDWQDIENKNREHIASLNLDSPSGAIKSALGAPDFNEVFSSDLGKIQVLYYRTQRTKDDGITTKDECTPLVFVDDALQGWGESALQRVL